MTVGQAARAAGREIVGGPDEDPSCYFVSPEGGPEGVGFMVYERRIARVDIDEGPISTRSGARIGSTEEEIKALFPGQIEVSPHEYVEGHYLELIPRDPDEAEYRVVFETDGKVVTRYRAGKLPAVGFIEGCS
jgi:hypothetical protein